MWILPIEVNKNEKDEWIMTNDCVYFQMQKRVYKNETNNEKNDQKFKKTLRFSFSYINWISKSTFINSEEIDKDRKEVDKSLYRIIFTPLKKNKIYGKNKKIYKRLVIATSLIENDLNAEWLYLVDLMKSNLCKYKI